MWANTKKAVYPFLGGLSWRAPKKKQKKILGVNTRIVGRLTFLLWGEPSIKGRALGEGDALRISL